jgi:hypothetical protein
MKENPMKNLMRRCLVLTLASVQLLAFRAAMAGEWNLEEKPWEKFSVNTGVFLTAVDSSVRFGSGLGVDIDVEKALDLNSTNTVFRADALWRFTQNRRHRIDFTWFSFRRDGNRQIIEDIIIEDDDGNTITIPWKHVGIGLGFDTLGIRLESENEDWPGIDLKGKVEFNYAGLQLYLRLFF